MSRGRDGPAAQAAFPELDRTTAGPGSRPTVTLQTDLLPDAPPPTRPLTTWHDRPVLDLVRTGCLTRHRYCLREQEGRVVTEATPFTVLVVDDEKDIRDSLAELLDTALPDIHVRTAADGEQGLEVLGAGDVDLVITDYRMPRMDGLEMLQEARRLHHDVDSIMLTAYPDPRLAQRAYEVGVALIIAKPFDMDYLIDVVRVKRDEH